MDHVFDYDLVLVPDMDNFSKKSIEFSRLFFWGLSSTFDLLASLFML